MLNIHRRHLLLGLGAAALWPGRSWAQAQQPLPEMGRLLVGFPPGGAPDIVGRRLAEQLSGKLAKSVIVENRPGAAGRIAVDAARQSPPDGLTLLLNPAGIHSINPLTYKKLSYDPFNDFTPITLAARIDFGFAVGPAVPEPVRTLADFARWAKTQKGGVNFGSPAAGSPAHFVGDALNRQLGLQMTHVPYRGAAPALNDLMGGQLTAAVLTLGDLVQQEKAGKLRLLAASGPARSKYAPNLPTFAEQGITGLDVRDWFGVFVAGKVPPETLARLAPLVRAACSSPAYVQALAQSSLEAAASSPQELETLARADLARWTPIVKASGFEAEV